MKCNQCIIFRFAQHIEYKNQRFNKRTITVAGGTPLPASFPFADGAFVIEINSDLSITLNGVRYVGSFLHIREPL